MMGETFASGEARSGAQRRGVMSESFASGEARSGAQRRGVLIEQLLRDRDKLIARISSGIELARTMRVMTATLIVAMAIVGATLGTYRGGVQIVYAAIKLPLLLLGTAALSAPALTALSAAAGRPAQLASDVTLVITSLAFGALLLAAATPLFLLGTTMDLSYHSMILFTVTLFAFAGIAALRMIVVGVRCGGEASGGAVIGLCAVFLLVAAQLGWALRPYLVRPRAPEPVFVRAVEGSLFDALASTIQSARGNYTRDAAPLPDGDLR